LHDQGVLHLDVKPSNIVIVGGRPILCDFGIARWRTEPRPEGMKGTFPFASPEECLFKKMITPAADVFGLGVTLYEMLTGRLPYQKKAGERDPQVSQKPSTIRRYRSAAPVKLERLVLKCLNRDPRRRPSLLTLLPALHRYIPRGPRMWPQRFRPERKTTRRRISRGGARS
jgi:serine/threonine protein kinase